jgi:transposase
MRPRFQVETDAPRQATGRPKKSKSKNKPAYDARAHLLRVLGIDLTEVTGISESIAQTIICEVGTDMSLFPTDRHFCSWLGLAPHNDISSGKIGSGAIRGRYEQWVDDLGLVSGYKASSAAQTTGAVAKLMGSFPI